jgi:hypothetical protein
MTKIDYRGPPRKRPEPITGNFEKLALAKAATAIADILKPNLKPKVREADVRAACAEPFPELRNAARAFGVDPPPRIAGLLAATLHLACCQHGEGIYAQEAGFSVGGRERRQNLPTIFPDLRRQVLHQD